MFSRKRERMNDQSKADSYDRANLESARLILANPEPWGGLDSGPAIWARLVLERLSAGGDARAEVHARKITRDLPHLRRTESEGRAVLLPGLQTTGEGPHLEVR